MTENAIISIHTVHNAEEDSVDFVTEGVYSFRDGEISVVYRESDVTGMEGTRTVISFRPEEIVLDRDGMIVSRMVFRQGVTNKLLYETPFGNTEMGINTLRIVQSFGEAGGFAEIDYVIGIQHRAFTEAKLVIRVEKQGEETDESYSGCERTD